MWTGGIGFQNAPVDQAGNLVVPSIQSPNYSAGVSGWQIAKDGSAEFNDMVMRGTVDIGTSTRYVKIYNDTGVGSPGPVIAMNENSANYPEDGVIHGSSFGGGSLSLVSPYDPATVNIPAELDLVSGDPNASPILGKAARVSGGLYVNGQVQVEPTAGNSVFTVDSTGISVNGVRPDNALISFTPTWTASTTAPLYGLGTTVTGFWKRLSTRFAYFTVDILFGTGVNFGSGAWGFSLPFTPMSGGAAQVGSAIMVDASANNRLPGALWITNGSGIFRVLTTVGSFGASGTSPFTWAAGDELIMSGIVAIDP